MAGLGITPYGINPFIYNNQIAMGDLPGMDCFGPSYGYMANPMMSMNGSIFGGGMPFMPGMSFMPGMGGNYEDYFREYEKYQDFMIDNQVRMQQKNRDADLRLNSPIEGVKARAALLHEKILRDEQQQIKDAYEAYLQGVKDLYGGNITEQEAKNRASAMYAQITGKALPADIREHGRDSFTQGFLQTLTFGLANKKTAEENISDLTGQPVGRKDQMKKTLGNVTGGAIVGGVASMLLFKPLFAILSVTSKSKSAWGMAAGAVLGGLAMLNSR